MSRQPRYGDVSENNPGNDGYGYEEHEQYVECSNILDGKNISKSESNVSPLFGDVLPNNPGNNGYGLEEHEQYVDVKLDFTGIDHESYKHKIDYEDTNARIMITPGEHREGVMAIANDYRMEYLGHAFYDSGEGITEQEFDENTAIFYQNSIPNKTRAFMKSVQDAYPDVEVDITNLLGPEDTQNAERFGIDLGGFNGMEL